MMYVKMIKLINFILILGLVGCSNNVDTNVANTENTKVKNLVFGKKRLKTNIVSKGDSVGPPDTPPKDGMFKLIKYNSSVGKLSAYITKDPKDGQKHPAIVWITGGDNNSIGDVWSKMPRYNDQSVSAFSKAGIVMMFPSQRGGNDNPGKREGFYGEVDDVLQATKYLKSMPYVDTNSIYLGGHSTGGTLVMLVGASSDIYQGIISLGPVAYADQYGGSYIYCDPLDKKEVCLRSPIYWLNDINTPMYVIEGESGNSGSIELMAQENRNNKVKFFKVMGHDHFSVIAPIVEKLAEQILDGHLLVTKHTIKSLK